MLPTIDHGILSPSGRVSKRYRKAAIDQAAQRLFGPESGFVAQISPSQSTERERLLHQARDLRALAARGMGVRKFIREAERLEALAAEALAAEAED